MNRRRRVKNRGGRVEEAKMRVFLCRAWLGFYLCGKDKKGELLYKWKNFIRSRGSRERERRGIV